MKGNPALDILCKASWLLCALAALHLGLSAVGFNFFDLDFVRNNLSELQKPLYYIFGLAGAWSLVSFFMHMADNK